MTTFPNDPPEDELPFPDDDVPVAQCEPLSPGERRNADAEDRDR